VRVHTNIHVVVSTHKSTRIHYACLRYFGLDDVTHIQVNVEFKRLPARVKLAYSHSNCLGQYTKCNHARVYARHPNSSAYCYAFCVPKKETLNKTKNLKTPPLQILPMTHMSIIKSLKTNMWSSKCGRQMSITSFQQYRGIVWPVEHLG
jgi:hypothetical protein